jgi:hypothetical protein
VRCAQALSGQLSAFERHEIVAACKEYGGIVIQPDKLKHVPQLDKLKQVPQLDKLKHVPQLRLNK